MERAVIRDIRPSLHPAFDALLQGFEQDASLLQPENLRQRLAALDALDAHACELSGRGPAAGAALGHRSRVLANALEAVNAAFFYDLRAQVQRGGGAAPFLQWIARLRDNGGRACEGFHYDALDELVQGVLQLSVPGTVSFPRHPEMVFYQPTPSRHVFHLMDAAALGPSDVLLDLGSGLGHVALLVALCTAARGTGVELEAGYVASARRCARDLHLGRATFVQADARTADLSAATLFYLHTPFTGSILRTVLDRLRSEAAGRPIRVCSFGPCSSVMAKEEWLQAMGVVKEDRIAIFRSHTGSAATAAG